MSEVNTEFQNEWQSEAAETAGKIAKSLTKKFFEHEAEELLGAIGGALTGGLSTLIVDGIFDLIDPPQDNSILDYLNEIEDIVKEEINDALKKDTLNKIADAINGIFVKLQTDYTPLRYPKKGGKPDKNFKLSDNYCKNLIDNYLSQYQSTIAASGGNSTDNIQILINTYPMAGFPIFVYAANLHLALKQEMATMYYWYNTGEGQGQYEAWIEPKTGEIAAKAAYYSKTIVSMWEEVIKTKSKQLSLQIEHDQGDLFRVILKDGSKVVLNNVVYGPADKINSIYTDYIELYYFPKTLNELCQGFSSPDALSDYWDVLVEKPLGDGHEQNGDKNLWPPSKDVDVASNDYFFLDGSKNIVLRPGDRLYSTDRAFHMRLNKDGNLEIKELDTGKTYWSTNQPIATPGTACLESSGNFTLKDGTGKVVWSSNTTGTNYLILDKSGMLNIRNSANSSLVWASEYGVLPSSIIIDNIVNAVSYNLPGFDTFLMGIAYKGIGSDFIFAAGSADGVSWNNGPFQLPSRMTTADPPGVGSFTDAMITLFKGNGNSHIYLNAGDPYSGSFGGLVELDNDVVNTSTTPIGVGTYVNQGVYKFTTVYKGASGDPSIYTFESDEIDDSSGTIQQQSGMNTEVSPAAVVMNRYATSPTFIYKGSANSKDPLIWTNVTGAPEVIPNGVGTSGRPAAVYTNDTLYVVYLGINDNKIWFTTYESGEWAKAPTALPEPVRTDIAPAVAAIGKRVLVYYKGQNDNRVYCYILTQ